jgi:hypothetical protein
MSKFMCPRNLILLQHVLISITKVHQLKEMFVSYIYHIVSQLSMQFNCYASSSSGTESKTSSESLRSSLCVPQDIVSEQFRLISDGI